MKPEYPILWAKISMIIAVPIVAITLIFYVSYAFTRTSSDLYSMALTAFGTTAILSSVCFGMASTNTDDSLFRYAGEKFLHSSLLIIQSIIVLYAKNAILNITVITIPITIKKVIISVFGIVIMFVSSMASITWLHGFEILNKELWKKYKKRI
jgi:hypothetical protein